VVAITDAENLAAARLLERLELRREGTFVENIWFKGAWGSEFSYAMLHREWARKDRA
jgi:RimJ/RimL family protein N-acetyltransferase